MGVVVRNDRIVPPESLKTHILKIVHRGHPGVVMMKRTIREKLWWPGLEKDVDDFVKSCMGCVAMSKVNPPEPMQRTELPEQPWKLLGVDYLTVPDCGTSFLTVVDYYSRYLAVKNVKETNATNTIKALEEIFYQWAYPVTLRLDNGQPFASAEFAEYAKSKNIALDFSIPYWPQMNGAIERQNRGCVRALQIGKVEARNWKEAMHLYVYAYNIRPHSVTDKAPLELMTGREIKDLLPSVRKYQPPNDSEIRERDRQSKEKGKEMEDERRRARISEIKVGDFVLVVNKKLGKLQPHFTPDPMKVIKRSGNETLIQSKQGTVYRRCITDLKKWAETESNPEVEDHRPTRKDQPQQTPEALPEMSSRPKRLTRKPVRFEAGEISSSTCHMNQTEEGNVES